MLYSNSFIKRKIYANNLILDETNNYYQFYMCQYVQYSIREI